jgi:hypothetical protein
MRVIYDGPIDRVEIPMRKTPPIVAERGVPVDVPDEIGTSLIRQATWTKAAPAKAPATKAPEADKKED